MRVKLERDAIQPLKVEDSRVGNGYGCDGKGYEKCRRNDGVYGNGCEFKLSEV